MIELKVLDNEIELKKYICLLKIDFIISVYKHIFILSKVNI